MVDRSWLRRRVRGSRIQPDGSIKPITEDADWEDLEYSEEHFRKKITRDYGLKLKNKLECATVEFNWEESKPKYGVVAYDVVWKFGNPKGRTNHAATYYVFLEPYYVTHDFITNVMENRCDSYMKWGKEKTAYTVWNVVSDWEHLKTEGRYTTRPDPILLKVAAAIGLKRLTSKVITFEE